MLKSNTTLQWIGLQDNSEINHPTTSTENSCTCKEDDIHSLLNTIHYHNSTLQVLLLSEYMTTQDRITNLLLNINNTRQQNGKEILMTSYGNYFALQSKAKAIVPYAHNHCRCS